MTNEMKIKNAKDIAEELNVVDGFIDTLVFILDENHEDLVKTTMQKENAPMWLAHEFNRTSDHMANIHHMLRKNIIKAEKLREQLIDTLVKPSSTN
ncbi:hypothetical protein LZ578_08235 [Jeotgalibaca sp. MA1X17-3]|uniref:hypothetical protein n=1 Tax=Jeotgalibaca sp. MA1X17-3 TaxID=2908211 RepID=UPI001F44C366|nr:hypothetical protein [Jeotgalibaca sp. MA1X17-3]UJF14994.1 hypothetical protein LZ578_08235 [Jeotgalibaca sp. MA1X17-3]